MKKMMFILALTLVVGLAGCAPVEAPTAQTPQPTTTAQTESAGPQVERINTTITPEEAQKLIGTEGVYLIDVRTVEEYQGGHIPGSMNLPLDKLESIQMIVPYPDKTIIVYCRSGNRSAQAAQQLSGYGYNVIYDLGGIQSWPYEIVK